MKKIVLPIIFVSAFILMLFSAKMDSITTDEGVHLFAGYTYLTQRDFRLDPEHPPLLKKIGALPLLFINNLNYTLGEKWEKAGNFYYDSWQEARILGDIFVANNSNNIIFVSRIMFVLLTMILGIFSFFWAKKLYGEKAGIFSAFLILFLPNILANGRLINTDFGLTLFFFLAIYFWGKFLKEPKILNLIIAGIFLGLVLASKFTGIMIVPIFILLIIIKLILQKSWKNWPKYLLGILLSSIVSFLIIWGTYGFSIQSPKYFYKGLVMVATHSAGGHASYLLGQTSNTGWWYYFPVAIFFKTPIPIFIFLLITIIYFKKIKSKDIFDEYLILIPLIVFLLFAMISKANLGVRHVLPILPFLILFISKSINLIDFKKWRLGTIGFIVLIFWYFVSSVFSFPNYLAYFNEFAGGPKNGYKILTDSNLDWGQDVFRIKKYMDENNLDHVYLVYPWDGDEILKYYGINFTPLKPDDRQAKGKAVVSATYYETDAYKWLKQFPMEQITPGVFLVELN